MKNPSRNILQELKISQGFSDKEINTLIQEFISTPRNINNPQYASFFAEYFYQKLDYKKSINYCLRSLQYDFRYDTLIILVSSCIKNGTEEWKSNFFKLDTFFEHPNWFKETHPEELKLITEKYKKDKY